MSAFFQIYRLFKITKKKKNSIKVKFVLLLFIHWIREEFRVELEQVTGY